MQAGVCFWRKAVRLRRSAPVCRAHCLRKDLLRSSGIAAACLRLRGRLYRLWGRRCSLGRLNRGRGHSCGLCGGLRYGYFCTAILAEFSTGL